MAESIKNFASRCKEAAGVPFGEIPRRQFVAGDPIPGKVLCRRGSLFLFAVGPADSEDADGGEVWDPRPENFVLADLGNEAGLLKQIEAEEDAEALLRLAVEAQSRGWVKAHTMALARAIERA